MCEIQKKIYINHLGMINYPKKERKQRVSASFHSLPYKIPGVVSSTCLDGKKKSEASVNQSLWNHKCLISWTFSRKVKQDKQVKDGLLLISPLASQTHTNVRKHWLSELCVILLKDFFFFLNDNTVNHRHLNFSNFITCFSGTAHSSCY